MIIIFKNITYVISSLFICLILLILYIFGGIIYIFGMTLRQLKKTIKHTQNEKKQII